MDDILLTGNDVEMLQETKESLERSFSMKDLGVATYIPGQMQRLAGIQMLVLLMAQASKTC